MLVTNISKLYDANAERTDQLWRSLAKDTPKEARAAVKSNATLSRQLLFAFDGKVGVLSFPNVSTDNNNGIILLGCFGDNINALAPAAIAGNLVNQSFSTLVPKIKANRHKLPSLTADPLELEAPDPSNVSPGPNRLHVSFDDLEHTPVIAALPAMFPVPLGR
jgi:hypothetical protein